MSSGTLFVISAPSGAGKSTLCQELRKAFPKLEYSISFTTRKARPGETAGVDYFFISRAEFEKRIQAQRWAEWALVHDNYYGTSVDYLDEKRHRGEDILLDIDVQGAMQIVSRYPDAVTIFIMPPSFDVLRQRLERRATESAHEVEKRLTNAQMEMAQKDRYGHIIVNDVLAVAVRELIDLVRRYGNVTAGTKP